ncbi:hypothetical protein BDW62DRAFT_215459 [Aspergillus aurantiobrunneus]
MCAGIIRQAESDSDDTRSCNFGAVTRDQFSSLGLVFSTLLLAVSPFLPLTFNQISFHRSLAVFSGLPLGLDVKPLRPPCGPYRCAAPSYCPLSGSPHTHHDGVFFSRISILSIIVSPTYLIVYTYSGGGSASGLRVCAFPQRPSW